MMNTKSMNKETTMVKANKITPGRLASFGANTDIQTISRARKFNRSWQKRAFDLLLTIPGTIVISPLLLITAIAIRIDSPGPAFFKQKRVGLDGKIFEIYKFRSMRNDADEKLHIKQILAYANGDLEGEESYKLKDDPRITRVGKFIRRTSIDELPQVINVIKGEMSLVGPRPVPIYEADQYNLWHSERLTTLPGVTGLWQVSERSSASFDSQLRLDIRYIRNQSLKLNFQILLKTLPAVLSKKGAG
jgi:lipopolysaccharide/colanic/teichoic acid biosynthesis glycosyltransferase